MGPLGIEGRAGNPEPKGICDGGWTGIAEGGG